MWILDKVKLGRKKMDMVTKVVFNTVEKQSFFFLASLLGLVQVLVSCNKF